MIFYRTNKSTCVVAVARAVCNCGSSWVSQGLNAQWQHSIFLKALHNRGRDKDGVQSQLKLHSSLDKTQSCYPPNENKLTYSDFTLWNGGQQNSVLQWAQCSSRAHDRSRRNEAREISLFLSLFMELRYSPVLHTLFTLGYAHCVHLLRLKTFCALGRLLIVTSLPPPCSNCSTHPTQAAPTKAPAWCSFNKRAPYCCRTRKQIEAL